jgi:hypothetical protein
VNDQVNEDQNASDESLESPRPALVHELIYCEDEKEYTELSALIGREWPNAVFEDGSDMVHEHRFAITIAGIETDDFFRFAIIKKFALSCLGFQLIKMSDPKHCLELIRSVNAPSTH